MSVHIEPLDGGFGSRPGQRLLSSPPEQVRKGYHGKVLLTLHLWKRDGWLVGEDVRFHDRRPHEEYGAMSRYGAKLEGPHLVARRDWTDNRPFKGPLPAWYVVLGMHLLACEEPYAFSLTLFGQPRAASLIFGNHHGGGHRQDMLATAVLVGDDPFDPLSQPPGINRDTMQLVVLARELVKAGHL